jgi:acyl-CoA synthetase (AMP-forming)/AMP-acid ligase II/acyl carrier protein
MSESNTDQRSVNQTAETLVQLISELIAELHPQQKFIKVVNLDSALGRDLGMDSLVRVELFTRVESRFHINLPEQAFAEVETPRDLLRAIARAHGSRSQYSSSVISDLTMGEGAVAPDTAQTLVDVLYWHVATHPDRPHTQFYSEVKPAEVISYRTLLTGALKIAAGLQQSGLEQGQAVTIMLATSTDYFYSFFGILLAGGIPVPIYPPVRRSQLEDHLRRQFNILNNCQLQYTSGSTGSPKGVILTHTNLLANIRAVGNAVQANPDDVFISWLPLYHDMGLIGAWFGSLYFSVLLIIMSPLAFLSRPQRWLWAIHKFKGTLSAAPNFAYELCLSKIKDEENHNKFL